MSQSPLNFCKTYNRYSSYSFRWHLHDESETQNILPCYQECRIFYNFYPDSDMALLYQFRRHRYRLTHLVAHHNDRESPSAEATGCYLLGLRQVPFCRDQTHHVQLLQQQCALLDAERMIRLDFLDLLTQFPYIAWQFIISTIISINVYTFILIILFLYSILRYIVNTVYLYFIIQYYICMYILNFRIYIFTSHHNSFTYTV